MIGFDLTSLIISRNISDQIVSYRILPLLLSFALFCSALLYFIVCNITLLLHWSVQYFIRIHDMTWHDITTFFVMIEFVLISCNFFRSTSFHVIQYYDVYDGMICAYQCMRQHICIISKCLVWQYHGCILIIMSWLVFLCSLMECC